MKDVIIGIDAGTSVIKAVAFDLKGRQLAVDAIPNTYETSDDGGSEQDMDRTWTETARTLRGLTDKVPNLSSRVAAIAVTGQGDGTWLIDASGEPVAPAWLWLDARSSDIAKEMRSRPEDQDRFAATATGLAACQQGPQLNWLAKHAPQLLERASHAMHCKDWIYFKLTGDRATDPSEGTFTFGDFRSRAYSDDVIRILGLNRHRHLLPDIVDGVSEPSALMPSAADEIGLPDGTPIVLGYVDIICTALGAGLYERDAELGCTIVGSTGVHMRLVSSPEAVTLNDDRTGYTMPMPVPGVFTQLQTNMASTINIDWLLDVAIGLLATQGTERTRADLIPAIDRWIDETSPGALLYQPYISEAGERGPFIDANARAGFIGLSSRHGFADLMRSVVEGLALAGRDCYAAMGPFPSEIRLTGGAARSAALRSVFGAVLDAKLRTSKREEAGAAGAAMMAAVAIGLYDDMDGCVSEWVTPLLGDIESPDAELCEVYDRVYPAYAQARDRLRPVWETLSDHRRASA